jgi:hypothetical protein
LLQRWRDGRHDAEEIVMVCGLRQRNSTWPSISSGVMTSHMSTSSWISSP